MDGFFPLIAPTGTRVEVAGRSRRDTLVSRGYKAEKLPNIPVQHRRKVRISADVVLAPWDAARVRNVQGYEIPSLAHVRDDAREGCWPTVKRAWENGSGAGGTHHLVLTDDLTLPKGFWEALNICVGLFPDAPLSLLTVKPSAAFALTKGNWCVSWGCTGAANVLPVSMIEPFLTWEASNIAPDCPHDDVRLTAWATAQGIGVLTPVPTLVDHGAFPGVIEDSPVFGKHHATSTVFQEDVTGIDWTRGADDPYFIGVSVGRPDPWLTDGRTLEDLRN